MGNLVWLASYPKSGNTWLRSFLYNLFSGADHPADINQLSNFCLGESDLRWYEDYAERKIDTKDDPYIASIRTAVQHRFTRAHADSVFVKTHNYLGEAHGYPLHNMDVTAATIYVLRNPLDVAVSMTDHFQINLDQAVDYLTKANAATLTDLQHVFERHTDWSTHVSSWTQEPHPQLHIVRYEDLLRQPRIYFSKIARFLGLKPPAQRLNQAIQHASFRQLQHQEQSKGFSERPKEATSFFRSGKAGEGRRVMEQSQIDTIIAAHHVQMKRFGYPTAHKSRTANR